jgi:hypothetical protein
MEFFPQAEAGWEHENPYWAPHRFEGWMKDKTIFLIPDLRSAPFAYPTLSKRTQSGDQTVTYPAELTGYLIVPQKRTKPVVKRKLPSADDPTVDQKDFEQAVINAQNKKKALKLTKNK